MVNQHNSHIITKVGILKSNPDLYNSLISECYAAVCRNTWSGFWVYKPKSETIWFSDELIQLLNLTNDSESITKSFEEIILTNEERDKFYNALNEFLIDQKNNEFELRFKDSKCQRVLLNNFSVLENTNNEEKYIICTVKDITKIKQNEEKLARQKEKAYEADKIKSIFLKNISHEIRTPMNSVIGFIELLNIGDFSDEKKQEFLTIIKNKSKFLLSLIDDIAELSKFESGDIAVNKTETNIPKLLNELYQVLTKEKERKNKGHLEIFLIPPPTDPQHITAFTDSGRIHQVMEYLLDNALKYTEKGYIQFGYDVKDNKQLVFTVRDTGVGISKEAQKYLFNRFKINEDTIDPKHCHFGLGLTISRSIIEHMGGKILVESTPGHGSVFTFTLPFQKTEKPSGNIQNETLHTTYNWRNKVILVAEDDEVNYHFLEAVLADTQARLIHVLNGKQAIELCRTLTNIDLVLMDIRMPEKSGFEAIKEIKKMNPALPIIAQTAYTAKEEKEKCQKAGCDAYLTKPLDIELLLEKINSFFIEQ